MPSTGICEQRMRVHHECSFYLRKHRVLASRTYSLVPFSHQYGSTKCSLNVSDDFLLLLCKTVSNGFHPYAVCQRQGMRLTLVLCLASNQAVAKLRVSLTMIVFKIRFIWDLQLKSSSDSFQSQLLMTSLENLIVSMWYLQ